MNESLETVYESLWNYCEKEEFAGYDPFDGLRSRIFQALPFKFIAPARLVWLQIVKRSSYNLRPLLKIDKGVNAKGIALFVLAELSRFRATKRAQHADNAKFLLTKLAALKFETKSGLAFGYNFDWQSRAFFAPRGTPTVVPTAFAAQAFIEAYELFGDDEHLGIAKSIAEFVAKDLNRIDETDDEVCFSYTPLDRSVIYNASLLAAEVLAKTGSIVGNQEWTDLARKAANFVVRRQRDDGAWAYGVKLRHAWVDNFHTAYILLSLFRLQRVVPDLDCGASIAKGFEFWLANFFLDDGTPKYYDKETFPVDIHSAAAAVSALGELESFDARALPMAEKVADWMIANMRDPEGFFYYQKRPRGMVEIPFIRWGEAWTAFAFARLIEARNA